MILQCALQDPPPVVPPVAYQVRAVKLDNAARSIREELEFSIREELARVQTLHHPVIP